MKDTTIITDTLDSLSRWLIEDQQFAAKLKSELMQGLYRGSEQGLRTAISILAVNASLASYWAPSC